MEEKRLVFVPSPHMGHLVATVELARLILQLSTHLTITIIAIPPFLPNPQLSSYISATSIPNLSFFHLQPITPPHFPTPLSETVASVNLSFYFPDVKLAISTLYRTSTAPIAAMVLDLLNADLIDVADEFGIPAYVFFSSNAAMLGFLLHLPTLDLHLPENRVFLEMERETIAFPGFASELPHEVFPDPVAMGKNEFYRWFLKVGRCLAEVKGVLVNTFAGLEPDVIKALQEGLYIMDRSTPQVYPVGPILSLKAEPEHECLSWLNEQSPRSVVFLCFGSMGKLPERQLREIAIGLERSGHRFLWVVRAPPKTEEEKFVASTDAVLDELLPDGFLERTRERGLVWPSFAPQTEILAHEAVGGFVTHCGWNSCLESLWFGMPTAAWPQYAEQHLNAFEMVEEMGMAVEVRVNRLAGNWAAAEEVERAVRMLMGEESRAVREKVMEMKEEARKAVAEGGSSSCSLRRVVEEWGRSV